MSQAPRVPHPAIAAFNRRLTQTYEAAGPPGPKRLQEISKTLPGSVELVKSTLHDNLKGTRLTLPPWNWVAMLVRSLRVAVKDNDLDADRVVGTVEEWNQRYQSAKQAAKQPPEPPDIPLAAPIAQHAAVADAPALAAGPAEPPGPPSVGAADSPSMDVDAVVGVPPPDLPEDLEFIGSSHPVPEAWGWDPLGKHGADLARAAKHGDAEAASRLGILLICYRIKPGDARRLLQHAAAAGDVMADALLAAAPHRRRQLAAECAFELALPHDMPQPEGITSRSPAVYYEAAAQAGHASAAFRLGMLNEAQGDVAAALYWYERATSVHYPGAYARSKHLRDTRRQPPQRM